MVTTVAGPTTKNGNGFRINYGGEIQSELDRLALRITVEPALTAQYRPRWLALKLLEGDPDLTARVGVLAGGDGCAGRGAGRGRTHRGCLWRHRRTLRWPMPAMGLFTA